MTQTIHLNPSDVPLTLIHASGYSGRKWQIRVSESVDVNNTQWSGGTRNSYVIVKLEDGQSMHVRDPRPWPESMSDVGRVAIPVGCAVLEHAIFCGKDLGVRIFLRPENATKMLPASDAELPRCMKIVLAATRSLKANYGGIKEYRFHEASGATGITRAEWDASKRLLIEGCYLTKIGSITPKGRNAIGITQLHQLRPAGTLDEYWKGSVSASVEATPPVIIKAS